MTLKKLVKKIHIYVGLQSIVALLLFSITVLTLSTSDSVEPEIIHYQFSGHTNKDNIKLAVEMHQQVGLKFEAVPEWWKVSEDEFGKVLIRQLSPSAKREIRLNKQTSDIEIRSWPLSVSDFINHMHAESIGRRRFTDSLWLWAWSLYIEFSVIALFLLPVTGLYIWLITKSTKESWAQLSLGLSSMMMIILWNFLR